jgi:hypothetical protein
MGNVRLYGSTSGYTELAPPAVAPDGVLSLPSGTGTLLTAEGGKVLQIVRATDTTDRSTTSTSFVDVTGMSVTITPQSVTSQILLVAAFQFSVLSGSAGARRGDFIITDSANNSLMGSGAILGGYDAAAVSVHYYQTSSIFTMDSPASLTAQTYKLRFKAGSSGYTVYVNSSYYTSQMYAIEVSA